MSRPINMGEVRAVLRQEVADSAKGRREQTGRLRRILRRIVSELNPGRDRMRDLEQIRAQVLHAIGERVNYGDGWAENPQFAAPSTKPPADR